MKKTLAILTAALLLLSLMAIPAAAHKANASYGDVPKTSDSIAIDGEKDAVYDKGLKLDIFRTQVYDEEDTDTRGAAWILWSDGFLYIYSEIKDKTIVPVGDYLDQSGQPWMCDSLEVFIDWANDEEGGDFDQFRIDAYGYRSFQTNITDGENSYGQEESAADGVFEGKAKFIDGGYAVEFKIPIQKGRGAGADIGFLFQINDMTDPDTRAMVFSGSSTGEAKSWVPAEADFIVLSAGEVTGVVEEEAAPPPEEEAAPAPVEEAAPVAAVEPQTEVPAAAPQTGDNPAMYFVIAAMAVLLAGSKKRRSEI